MKRTLKTRIIKKTASILTATIIFTSGGYTAIANMFGSQKNNNKNQIGEEKEYSKTISNTVSINKDLISKQNKYQYKYNSPEENYFMINFETIEPISQKENINRLIRKRKKETQEKLMTNNK